MEKIDWGRPIELMDGAHAKWRQRVTDKAITTERGLEGFVNDYGCIGGVQVVRNRKEPEKHKVTGFIECYLSCDGKITPVATTPDMKMHIGLGPEFKLIARIPFSCEFAEGEGL